MYSYLERDSAIVKNKQEMTTKFEKLEQTTQRFTHVEHKGKKRARILVPETTARLKERLSKIGMVLNCRPHGGGIHSDFIVHSNGDYLYAHAFYPLTNQFIQKQFKLSIVISGMAIKKHAIERFLERKNTLDVPRALKTLGEAINKLNNNLAQLSVTDNVIPVGFHERQVICEDDGGIAIILVDNIEEQRIEDMNWTVVTYIDETLVREFNLKLASSDYEGDHLVVAKPNDLAKVALPQKFKDIFW